MTNPPPVPKISLAAYLERIRPSAAPKPKGWAA